MAQEALRARSRGRPAPAPAGPTMPGAAQAAPLARIATVLNAAPAVERLTSLQGRLSPPPRSALRGEVTAQRTARTTQPASAALPAQRVRFSQTNSFYGDQLSASDVPAELAAAMTSHYPGRPVASDFMVALTDPGRRWIEQHGGMPTDPGQFVWAEMQAGDWERLGAKAPGAMDIGGMEENFFDRQNTLMDALADHLTRIGQLQPNRPNRIASFRFGRNGSGHLEASFAAKDIEQQVQQFITSSFLTNVDGAEDLRSEVRANVTQTLLSAGQLQWIAQHWNAISATHDVYVDVDYYNNRTPDSGGGLHKDSIGETLFVNLTYNNAQDGASPEYIVDNQGYAPFEHNFPQPARDLIGARRHENRNDDGAIKGVTLPARGRVSFIDPAVWHATPLYDHRVPDLKVPVDAVDTVRNLRDHINAQPLSTGQKNAALGIFNNEADDRRVDGKTINDLFASRQTFNRGQIVNAPYPLPGGRRERRRSVDLNAHPERLAGLQQQSQAPRSFIRTWIILRRR